MFSSIFFNLMPLSLLCAPSAFSITSAARFWHKCPHYSGARNWYRLHLGIDFRFFFFVSRFFSFFKNLSGLRGRYTLPYLSIRLRAEFFGFGKSPIDISSSLHELLYHICAFPSKPPATLLIAHRIIAFTSFCCSIFQALLVLPYSRGRLLLKMPILFSIPAIYHNRNRKSRPGWHHDSISSGQRFAPQA